MMTFAAYEEWARTHGVQSIMLPHERRAIWEVAMTVPVPSALSRAVEIGVCYGGTTALLACAGLWQVTGIDNWQAGDTAKRETHRVAALLADMHLPIELWEEASADCAYRIFDASCGLVLIDGDHTGTAPLDDLRLYGPKVARGGYLLIDDVANGHPAVTAAVVQYLTESRSLAWQLHSVCGDDASACHRLTKLIILRRGDV